MRHRDDLLAIRMFEGVMVAVDAIQHPSILLQHFDQLAAVSFHVAHLVECSRSDRQQYELLERAGMGCPDRVYKYTQKYH